MPLNINQLNFIPAKTDDKKKFYYFKNKIKSKYGVSCRIRAITENLKYWVSEGGDAFVFRKDEPFKINTKKLRIGGYSYVRSTLTKSVFNKKLKRQEVSAFRKKYKRKTANKKDKNKIFLEPLLDNLVLYAVEDLEDQKVFIGYDHAKNLIGTDLVNYLYERCKQSWVVTTLRDKGRASIRVRLLTLGNTKNEIHELFGIYAAIYENKKWSVVNIDYLQGTSDHYFMLKLSKETIKRKTYKPYVSKSFRKWIKSKRELFSKFDDFVYDIEIPESEI
jgi:hypothetical protein